MPSRGDCAAQVLLGCFRQLGSWELGSPGSSRLRHHHELPTVPSPCPGEQQEPSWDPAGSCTLSVSKGYELQRGAACSLHQLQQWARGFLQAAVLPCPAHEVNHFPARLTTGCRNMLMLCLASLLSASWSSSSSCDQRQGLPWGSNLGWLSTQHPA